MPVVGTVMKIKCVSCQEGCGPWTHCVTVVGVEGITCCAKCHFRSQDHRCRWPSPTPPPIFQPASSNARPPSGPGTDQQAREDRTFNQAAPRTRTPLQVLTPEALVIPQQNITQAARLREEVEGAWRRLQQSHDSLETYSHTSIQTMSLLQAYITQSQGADGARSAALMTTLSGYIDLTMQNLTAARKKDW